MAARKDQPSYQPLTQCRCGSRLIYPTAVRSGPGGRALVDRRCPECETRDTVWTTADAAAVWTHHQSYLRSLLQASLPNR